MAAALAAADAGASAIVVDSQAELGGQYWRHLPADRDQSGQAGLHHSWSTFEGLAARIASSPHVHVFAESSVWAVEPPAADSAPGSGPVVDIVTGPGDGAARARTRIQPDAIVIATGAHDRTLPFPGWDLPGVFTGGAAQAFVKAERLALGQRVVVAGAGPFLLPVAASIAQAGSQVLEVVEASRPPRLLRGWLPKPWQLAGSPNKLLELAGYAAGHVRHRIPYRLGQAVIAAEGDGCVERVRIGSVDASWRPVPGSERVVECDAVCVTHGFTPRLEVAIAAGCRLSSERFVVVDDACRTSVPAVFAAGELTGIGGVDLSLAEGTVAGHCAAGGQPADEAISRAQRKRAVYGAFAARLERAHGIGADWQSWVTGDTVVCRCEEVTAAQLRRSARATGSASLRSQKLSTRAGLGICQARVCGRSVEEIIRTEVGLDALDEAIVDRRPIQTPVRLGELASPPDTRTPS